MSEIPESFFTYLEAWNEPDPAKVRGLLEKSVASDVLFVDPAHTTRGVDELEAMILEAHKERPTVRYVRVSGVDGHNLRYRYLWEVRQGSDVLLPGMDVTTVDESGAIVQIDGFFGGFPPLES